MTERLVIRRADQTLLELAGNTTAAGWLAAWQRYCDVEHELLTYYAHVSDASLSDVDADMLQDAAPQIEARFAALDLSSAGELAGDLLDVTAGAPVPVTTLIGMNRAMAWCDDELDPPALFFCLERMPDDPIEGRVVGIHEITHALHCATRTGRWLPWSLVTGLVMEAVAIASTRTLVPQAPEAEHLMLEDHPATICSWELRRDSITERLLELLADDANDETTFRDVFFPLWGRPAHPLFPEQVGYVIADEMQRAWAAAGIELRDVVRWDADTARDALCTHLRSGSVASSL